MIEYIQNATLAGLQTAFETWAVGKVQVTYKIVGAYHDGTNHILIIYTV